MTNLSKNMNLRESFGFPSIDAITDQSESIYNSSMNGTSDALDNEFGLSNEIMRLLFIAITTITVLVCLTICISACICICLNRRRNLKRQEKKDHLLIPEQSEKISDTKLSLTNPLSKHINLTLSSNSKPESEKKILPSSIRKSSSNLINGNTPMISYYYDNLDDIPFIDESRPTSYSDITRV
ncbi:unnamed protein product [Rotaria sp. Silwood2]|nr:unnamed protein product [Rotaria sp. Silwood2]CAF2590266.1 unnamed protein product [Rotaria sp. Silwood2]CAF2830273.1 unnamed protein product [Rotaria sp. Silwood2]CAF2974913.1 unnamed protein product [Rotaria sp. Silwood2]CAF3903219.1 unnamed protein product [Rotaria sp. Silwood2]